MLKPLVGNYYIHIALLDWQSSKIWREFLTKKGYVFYNLDQKKEIDDEN